MRCNLCPRKCDIDRTVKEGFCSSKETIKIARAALHMWEEPCISAQEGSGAIFFSGCNLRCIFCQNYGISCGKRGHDVTCDELAQVMLDLERQGANNINLVTAGHFLPNIIKSINVAKTGGLKLPIVYNTSGYESVKAIKALEGLVDVYLPDHKYYASELAANFSKAPDYHKVATDALDEMVRQCGGEAVFNEQGIMTKGVIVRHLVLPGHTKDSMAVLDFLHERYGNKIYISIMNQYTPMEQVAGFKEYPELLRKVTKREYEKVLAHATNIGIELGFAQEGDTAKESFIPDFE